MAILVSIPLFAAGNEQAGAVEPEPADERAAMEPPAEPGTGDRPEPAEDAAARGDAPADGAEPEPDAIVPELPPDPEPFAPVEAAPTAAEELGLADVLAASLASRPLPEDLEPSLADAEQALPRVYDDGCLTGYRQRTPDTCVYGTTQQPTRSVVLFGDSHAAHWFPPLHDIAVDHGWRLQPLVKGSCPSLDIPVVRSGVVFEECRDWQEASVQVIAELQPDLIVLSSVRDYAPIDGHGQPLARDRAAFHADGLTRMLQRLRHLVPDVEFAVIGTSPHAHGGAAACLASSPDDIAACAGPRADMVDLELLRLQRGVAATMGAIFVDPSAWMCHQGSCPPVVGNRLVYNVGSHLAPAFTAWLRPVLEEALLRDPPVARATMTLPSGSRPWR